MNITDVFVDENITYQQIKEKRLKYNISQIKLAKISGYTPAMISSWELEKRIPSIRELKNLLDCINQIIFKIKNEGMQINKKKIQKDYIRNKILPKIIKDANNYIDKITQIKYPKTKYTSCLHHLYQLMSKNPSLKAPKAISLFSGCGGLDAGFIAAGFNVVGHVELDEAARKLYEANFKNSTCLGKDICSISNDEINTWLNNYGNIDLLIGGPPCQGFSLAGKRDPNDTRNQLYKDYVRIVEKIEPKVFVMENVKLLTSMRTINGELFIDNIKAAFEKIGYNVFLFEVNAQDYGVPQSRERIFLIGTNKSKCKEKYIFPCRTHSSKDFSLFSQLLPYATFRDAASDLPSLKSGEISKDPLHWSISHPQHVIEWLKDVPEGGSAHDNKNPNLRPPSGFNTTYKRNIWDKPSSTISTNFSMISGCRNVHPTDTRSLTIREAARLQSFPDEFVFFGKWGDIRKAIGNAVPPYLSYIVAQSIYTQLFGK